VEQDARDPRRPRGGRRRTPVSIPMLDPAGRSPNADTCPFFRSIDATGSIRTPFEVAHDANRCLAVAEPTPQSIRQQQLVCLTAGHLNCPRYLRGALVTRQAPARALDRPLASPPVLLAAALLVLSAVVSVAFLFARGGMALTLPSSSPGAVAGGSGSPSAAPSGEPSLEASPAPPSPARTAFPSPTPTAPPPTPSPTAAPPSPMPTPSPTPAPTSDRYAVLVPCPDAPDCWLYTVRPGDNFQSIVNWFGVPFDTVARMNPQLGDLAILHVGDEIRIPPPTR
jgi:LysM domain-containing protein